MLGRYQQLITSLAAGIIGGALVVAVYSFIAPTQRAPSPITTTDSVFTPATTEEAAVVETVKQASPAVVSIIITKDVPVLDDFDFFPFFFRQPGRNNSGETEERQIGGGSGFFVSADGLIVTNRHVVEDEEATYTVITSDDERHEAEVVAIDPVLDIAIIKVKGEGTPPAVGQSFPFLTFGDSDKVQVGQSAIAIGNALGEFGNTVSVGVVSGLSRSIIASGEGGQPEVLDEVIQTDAAINPGNSGGPLLDLAGRVIGVNVAVARGSENIGFALPINLVKSAVDSVKATGKIVRPYIGVRYQMITKALKEKNKLSVDYGALVARGETPEDLAVIPGSPADKVGIVENDIILEIDDNKLDDDQSLASLIRQKKVGDEITLKLLHRGSEKTIKLTLEAAPE